MARTNADHLKDVAQRMGVTEEEAARRTIQLFKAVTQDQPSQK